MSEENPYQAPESNVVVPVVESNAELTGPKALAAGAGWQWIKSAFALFGKSPWMCILLLVVYFAITMLASLVPFLGLLAIFLFMFVLIAGVMLGIKALDDGGELQVDHLFAGFKHEKMGQLILCGALLMGFTVVLSILMAVVGAVFAGGAAFFSGANNDLLAGDVSLLMVLMALISTALTLPLVMMTWFAPMLIVFHKLPAWDAMKLSFSGCLKNIVPLLLYGLIMMLLSFVAIIPIGLGYFVLVPVSVISMYTAYKAVYTS